MLHCVCITSLGPWDALQDKWAECVMFWRRTKEWNLGPSLVTALWNTLLPLNTISKAWVSLSLLPIHLEGLIEMWAVCGYGEAQSGLSTTTVPKTTSLLCKHTRASFSPAQECCMSSFYPSLSLKKGRKMQIVTENTLGRVGVEGDSELALG